MILDILIIADDTVQNVHIPEVEWVYLPEGQGLVDVQCKLMVGEWPCEGVKIVVLIMGQAEAAVGHPTMSNSVVNALASVRHVYADAIILLCVPLPRPRDGLLVLKDLDTLSDVMHEVCTKHEYYEYSSLGSYFYGKFRLAEIRGNSGPSNVLLVKGGLMDAQGITVQGSRMIQKRLNDKIKSANLYHRYHMLSAKLINF